MLCQQKARKLGKKEYYHCPISNRIDFVISLCGSNHTATLLLVNKIYNYVDFVFQSGSFNSQHRFSAGQVIL